MRTARTASRSVQRSFLEVDALIDIAAPVVDAHPVAILRSALRHGFRMTLPTALINH